MLQVLHVKNYAIIREAEIIFGPKLNIITGETGAGKSILMGALGLILGERAESKVLLNTDEKCIVEGIFDIRSYGLAHFFETQELDYDDRCIIRREINNSGKSRAFINDTPVSLTQLKELGTKLVDIVSQNQTYMLHDEQFQLSLVDAIAACETELLAYQTTYKQWKANETLLKELTEKELSSRKDEDYLKFVLKELFDAQLNEGEQAELEMRLEILSHAEHIQQQALLSFGILNAQEQNIVDLLSQVKQMVSAAGRHHGGLNQLAERLQSSIIELKDISAELEQVATSVEANPEAIAKIESRLQLLFNLQKKHQVHSVEDLIQLQLELDAKLQRIGSLQSDIEHAKTESVRLTELINKAAKKLSDKRQKAIGTIESNIHSLLKNVQLNDAVFKVSHSHSESFSSTGIDRMLFLFSANKGSQPQPLHKVASGGELSRLMLCLKSLLNDKSDLPTVVFDEIDTGISGEAALKVAQVMKQHADKHQVIAITHLPQIAGKADTHFYIYKSSDKITTHTHISKLNETQRVEEIARMLHGENPSEKVIEAARELMG